MAREFRTSPDFKTAVLANGAAGTSGQVLTSAGAGAAPSWTTVSGGGGGLTKFTEAESTSSPNATVYVDSLTAAATSTNADVALVAKGSGATLAQVPDGTTAGGNKRGIYATDLQKARTAVHHVASGPYSVIAGGTSNQSGDFYCFIGGGQSNNLTNSYGVVCGGQGNNSGGSGVWSVVGGGANNTASSNYSFIGGGQANLAQSNTHATVCGGSGNTASGQYAFVGGGTGNTATNSGSVTAGGGNCTSTGIYSSILGGVNNSASGDYSSIIGGNFNTANSIFSAVLGGRRGTSRSIEGYQVSPACNAPIAAVAGVTQSALLLLARETTGNTATVLTSNTNAASTTNQVILPNNAAYSFSGEVIAGVTGAGNTARWTISGAIKRGASAATTAMVGTPTVTMTHNDAGAAAWVVNVTADTTNGGIKVEVTGAASTTIRWVCKLNTTEMTY